MFGTPFLTPTILGAIGIALIASLTGAFVAHKFDGIALSKAQAETAAVNASYEGYKARVAADAAKANSDALDQKTALEARANDLQNQLIETQKAADARSRSLQALLAAAKPGEIRALGPVASRYYLGLRSQAPAGHSANPGH